MMLRGLLLAASMWVMVFAAMADTASMSAIYTQPGELGMLVKNGHAQGVACSEKAIYVSHSGGIVKLDWTGRVVKSVTARPHLGDIAYSEGRIYGVFGLRKHAKGESPIMVGVWNEDLDYIESRRYDYPGARGIDGAVVLGGILYTSVDSHFDAERDHPPHRANDMMMISEENLALLGTKTVVFDYPIHYGTQTLGTDGERLLFGNYGAGHGEGNTNRFNFSRSTVDMELLDSRSFHASEGFSIVPKSVSKLETPVFLNVNALGGNMQGWRKDPKGNPPRLRFDFFAYDVQTGVMSNITDYSSARDADVALFRHRCASKGQAGAFCLGWSTSMEKIRPRDGALPKVATKLAVRLAQGETESVQLFVLPKSGALSNVRVAVGNLRSDNGAAFPKDAISVSVLGYVNIKNSPPYGMGVNERQKSAPGYKRKAVPCELGWWPDPILDYTNACDIADGDVQGFWLRVAAPEDQAPGVYGGMVRVAADGVAPVSVPLAIRVNAFTVPKKPMLPLAVSYRHVPLESTVAWTNGLSDVWARFAAEYKLSSCDLYCDAKRTPDFDMQVKLRALGGSECYNLGYWDPPKSTTNDADIAHWRIKTLEPLRARYAVAKERGLLDGAFIYGCDELWPKDFGRVAWAAMEIRAAIPDVPLMTTARDGSFGTGSSLSMVKRFAPVNVKFDQRRAECARAEGREVWWYFACDQKAPCANSFVEGQGIEMRSVMGAQIVKYRPDGFLYYWTTAWGKNKGRIEGGPFTDWNPCSYKDYHGDGSWICRGPGDVPLPTIRMENYRDGLEDYAYAMILGAKLVVRADKDDEWGRRAKELLAVPREVVDSVRNYTDDPAVIYRWRDEMADLIEECAE